MACYRVILNFTLPCVKTGYRDEDNIKVDSIGIGCEDVEWMLVTHRPVAVDVNKTIILHVP
jgi:hypothetical protein